MQVDTAVDEADIGRVTLDQEATFTVDAFPQITFRGKVTEIRNAAVIVQNVVTYDVVIQVKNPDLKLRPGMTANASVLVAQKDHILKIPNAALRFRPEFARREVTSKGAEATPGASPPQASALMKLERLRSELNLSLDQEAAISKVLEDMQKRILEARKASPETASVKAKELATAARAKIRSILNEEQRKKFEQMPEQTGTQTVLPKFRVWVSGPQKKPVPVEITTGISDGSFTEVLSGALQEGQEIIVEAMGSNNKGGAASAPQSLPGIKGGLCSRAEHKTRL
jgi:HlyD family secretion protein